jgi:hypothetical protein
MEGGEEAGGASDEDQCLARSIPDTLASMNNLTFTFQGEGHNDNTIRLVTGMFD